MSWEKIRFGDLFLEPTRNGIYKTAEFHGNGTKIVNMGELFANERIGKQNMSRVVLTEKEKEVSLLKEGDLLFARRSLIESGAGKASIVFGLNEETTFESSVIRVRLDKAKCNPLFYLYWLKSYNGRSAIRPLITGLNVKGIRGSELKEIIVDYPSPDTQNRISSLLSAYDDLIENNQKKIKLLEEAAQRLYKEWFVDLHFPGYENTKIVDGVPEGWERKTVDSMISLLSGYAFKSSQFDDSGEYKIVTIKNVKDGEFDGDNTSRIISIPDKMPKYCVLKEGDILLSLTGNVGRTCLVTGKNCLLNQRVAKLQSDIPAFTYCLFRSNDMFDAMNNLANGAAQQNLSPIRTGKLLILFPTDTLLREFERIAGSIINKMLSLRKQCEFAVQARDRLLPKLMSGEIEV